MLIKKEKKGDVDVYYVDKNIPDEKMDKYKNTKVKASDIDLILNKDSDVYRVNPEDPSGSGFSLLLRFRKNKISEANSKDFFDNVINFALRTTSNRGSTSGSKKRYIYDNPRIMSNIFGYFDKMSPIQKLKMKEQGKKFSLTVRETRFNMDYPEEYEKATHLIEQLDDLYKKYIPDKYEKQYNKAKQTPFRIKKTSFTTVTTNVNFQTTIHKDKGDDEEGFGNLVVIEDGKYSGAETCFPQYGVGVDVRTGDVLFMDVHQWHGNLPMKKEDADARRLSIVCYLRYNVWKNTKGKTKKFMDRHNNNVRNLRQDPKTKTRKNRS